MFFGETENPHSGIQAGKNTENAGSAEFLLVCRGNKRAGKERCILDPEKTPCPYCENFEASGFTAQGTVQVFRFCPMCGRPYARGEAAREDGTESLPQK